MKKKLLFSIITLFVVSLFTVTVNAATPKLNISNATKAKAPETIPSTSDVLYGTVTDKFDFSKLQFAPASGTTNINGKTDLKKIVLGKLKDFSSVDSLTLDSTFESWFTAYCLDNAKKYPIYGLLSSKAFASATTDELRLDEAVLAAIANDEKVEAAVKANSNLDGNITSIQVVELDEDNSVSERLYDLSGSDTASSVMTNINSLNIPVTIKLKKISFYKGMTEYTVTAADITGNASDTTYDLTFTGKDILLDKYNVTENNSVRGYDHALWIIEHSYPTLALKTSVEASGADYDALRKEVCELEGKTFDDTALTCTGLSNLDDYVENYVYGTVQYAIWKSTGHGVDGKELGDSVVNSVELNKLYQYLIKDRSEYNGYSTKTFTNKIKVTTPKEGKELYKETTNTYMYGPYKATYDVLAGGKMNLSVTNANKDGIKIVNESREEITTLENGGTFYIECTKSAKISSASVSVKLNDASVFDPLTNRGRIYFPRYSVQQNVMSGGKIINKNLETSVDLLVNPQTGVENVALLLMVTLVAFTLAYLVLSYKQKPVKLN